MPNRARYYHWAPHPVRLRRMRYLQSGQPKPNGLWFDVNGEWERWCASARFRPETFRYRHTVTILDASRILHLRSAKDIDAFTRKYGRDLSDRIRLLEGAQDLDAFTLNYGTYLFSDIRRQFSNYILWGDVAEQYGGIIIAPYSRSRSRTYLWYYGWHCASGCVWDTGIIRLGKPCRMAE